MTSQELAEQLKRNSRPTKLDLDWCSLGDADAEAAAVFSTSTSSFEAEPRSGRTAGGGAEAVADALKINTVVTKINLIYNKIGDAGAKALLLLFLSAFFFGQKTLCLLIVRLPFSTGIG